MQENIQEYLAKPDKTIKEHAQDLLDQAAILWKMGYVKDEHIYVIALSEHNNKTINISSGHKYSACCRSRL